MRCLTVPRLRFNWLPQDTISKAQPLLLVRDAEFDLRPRSVVPGLEPYDFNRFAQRPPRPFDKFGKRSTSSSV